MCQVAEAEAVYEEAAVRLEKQLGARHASTITAKINLAVGTRTSFLETRNYSLSLSPP